MRKKTKVAQTLAPVAPKGLTPYQLDKIIEKALPSWVVEKKDAANAMFATAQEFLLVIEDALIRYHQFSPEELKRLHDEIRPVLQGVAEFERHGLSLLSPGDIEAVGDIVETRMLKEGANRAGIELPVMPHAKPLIDQIRKRNKLR